MNNEPGEMVARFGLFKLADRKEQRGELLSLLLQRQVLLLSDCLKGSDSVALEGLAFGGGC